MKTCKNKAFLAITLLLLTLVFLPWPRNAASFPSTGKKLKGVASWYSHKDPGVKPTTASMERFNDQLYTCAMWGVPFNTLVKVTNRNNGKSVVVRVNDRGPAKRLVRKGRIIDLTRSAFSHISPLKQGLIEVDLEVMPSL